MIFHPELPTCFVVAPEAASQTSNRRFIVSDGTAGIGREHAASRSKVRDFLRQGSRPRQAIERS
jgi:hypothetical protein